MEKINIPRLIEERNKHGYSQKYVAVSVGVAPSIVSRWESGKTTPSRASLVKLSELYGISVDSLLGKSDEISAISEDSLLPEESALIRDYRSLNTQGQEYIRQTMFLALSIYKRHSDVSSVENQKIG